MFGAGGVGLWVNVTNQRILLACFLLALCGYESRGILTQCGTQRAHKWLDTFQNNRENGSLLVYFCLTPILGPILLKVGGELDHILESLRAFETNLFVIRGKCE